MRCILLYLLSVLTASGALSAKFIGADLVVRDGQSSFRLDGLVSEHSFYRTLHAVQRRGSEYFIVYGTSNLSRGWPAKGGYCGAGIESFIRWIQVKDGKIIADAKGLYESCFKNRDGGLIAWQKEKLVWESEGLEYAEGEGVNEFKWYSYRWIYDPSCPNEGIKESKVLSRFRNKKQTEQVVAPDGE